MKKIALKTGVDARDHILHSPDSLTRKFSDFLSLLPCVNYELEVDLTARIISPNIFELIGIRPDSLQGTRRLWQERFYREDRNRLIAQLDAAMPMKVLSEIHRIINDNGLPVWVAHSFWKLGAESEARIRGSMIPMQSDKYASIFDSGIISQFVHKIGNHFQLINLLIGSLRRIGTPTGDLDSLQDTVDRAIEFTRSFSLFAQVPGHTSNVDIGEVLNSAIQNIAPRFSEKGVILTGPKEPLEGMRLAGDSFLLESAFTSILENALDATDSGECVTVDSKSEKRGDRPASIAWISVTDAGCGMEKSTLAKASTPFFSSKPDRDGLGLTMAIRFFEMHGGLLNISSEKDRGTRVDIVLPIRDAKVVTTVASS